MTRVIPFRRQVERRSVERLLTVLREANAPRHVLVDSPGGRFDFFSTLAPALERQGIVTIAGDVRSAAVLLFLLGHTRQAFPDSTFFFHEVRAFVGPEEEITVADLEEVDEYAKELSGKNREYYQEWLRQMKAAQDWFLEFLSAKSGVSKSTFLSLMRGEATLSAQDAIRYGIAHEIIREDSLL